MLTCLHKIIGIKCELFACSKVLVAQKFVSIILHEGNCDPLKNLDESAFDSSQQGSIIELFMYLKNRKY